MAGELVLITGITGHIGFRTLVEALQSGYVVRGAVRSEGKIDAIKKAPSIQPFLDRLQFVIVSDILQEGAFDKALEGVDYVLHLASPLPVETEDFDRDLIQPAIKGTVGILASARKVPTVKRIVITSSGGILFPDGAILPKVRTEADIAPTPKSPYSNNFQAYLASKFLSYHATSDWYKANNPQFDIIRLLPTFVIGENELVSQKKDMMSGSNARVVGPISGIETTIPLPGTSVHLHDVARAHVRALNPKVEGNQDFILACNSPDGVVFDDALEIAKKHFPDAIASGVIPLGGTNPTVNFPIDASKAEKVLGLNFLSYEEQVKSVLTQWVELSATA